MVSSSTNDAVPVLMKALSETAGKIMSAMNDSEEEEDLALDVKSPEVTAKERGAATR